mgnify:CR=1 FL=1
MNGERRVFELPGAGLVCGRCQTLLPAVNRTRTTEGFVIRERKCPNCGELNTTTERVIGTRPIRSRRISINRDDYV